jgi:hypothetical protein
MNYTPTELELKDIGRHPAYLCELYQRQVTGMRNLTQTSEIEAAIARAEVLSRVSHAVLTGTDSNLPVEGQKH